MSEMRPHSGKATPRPGQSYRPATQVDRKAIDASVRATEAMADAPRHAATFPLRIDHAAKVCTWGAITFAMTDIRALGGKAFQFTATPGEFAASTVEIWPEKQLLIVDALPPQQLIGWHTERTPAGLVSSGESRDTRPDDPELVALFARRTALARAG